MANQVAYSYVRFSSPEQSKGDSVRRQAEKRDTWLKRMGLQLDTTLTLEDHGVSGFRGAHRENADKHALAAFLELVKQGRIAKGSYLVVESLDRLSRENIRPALTLLLTLIDHGIRVVQLLPVEVVFDEKVELTSLILALVEMSRGHSESAMKSERVGSAWREKKRRAAERREPATAQCPAWLKLVGGKFVVIEEAAEVVRHIFRRVIDGAGVGFVTGELNASKTPPIGRSKHWALSYVAKILHYPAVLGVYQPNVYRGGKPRPDGDSIPGYYPAIITESEWHAAHAALQSRRNHAGRVGTPRDLNLLAGLLYDARDGAKMHSAAKGRGSAARLVISSKAARGLGQGVSFPLRTLEQAILSLLKEIDPKEILPGKDHHGEKVLALTGKLQEVTGRVEKIKAKLEDTPDIDALVDVLKGLEAKRRTLEEELTLAQQEAATPLGKAWKQVRSLSEALAGEEDPAEVRVRLRAALRRTVSEIWLLTVPRGRDRFAALQIFFHGGKGHREYAILHRPALGGSVGKRPSQWWARSLASVLKPGQLDLRKRDHAERLAKAIEGREGLAEAVTE
jgi:DNA invertase Pin-like site-specific DNA recombinase